MAQENYQCQLYKMWPDFSDLNQDIFLSILIKKHRQEIMFYWPQ